jgi:hypothetical protein
VALAFALVLGCKASVNADANVSDEGARGRTEADMSGSGEGAGEMSRSALAPTSGAASPVNVPFGNVLLGARHDLKLESGKGSTSCQCLSVALGGASESGMTWSAGAPSLDASTQLGIALSSEGQACKNEPKHSLGASYWGYRISGNDVVVLVEAAREGRPLTSGAVIPKPVGPGQVFVAPASSTLPYGRALDGKGPCKLGNPGQPRTTAFTQFEIGSDAPRRATGDVTRGARQLAPNQLEDVPATIEVPPN